MPLADKILLRKRAIIEAVNDELKNICQIQHTRHRSFFNWAVNLLSGLVAFSFFPKKTFFEFEIQRQFTTFTLSLGRTHVTLLNLNTS